MYIHDINVPWPNNARLSLNVAVASSASKCQLGFFIVYLRARSCVYIHT
jgi:hypothetical protein